MLGPQLGPHGCVSSAQPGEAPIQLTHQAHSALTCQGHSPSLQSLPPTIRTRSSSWFSGLVSELLRPSRSKGLLVGLRCAGSYLSSTPLSGGPSLLWEAWSTDLFLCAWVCFPQGKGSERNKKVDWGCSKVKISLHRTLRTEREVQPHGNWVRLLEKRSGKSVLSTWEGCEELLGCRVLCALVGVGFKGDVTVPVQGTCTSCQRTSLCVSSTYMTVLWTLPGLTSVLTH